MKVKVTDILSFIASNLGFTPAGNISATNTQAAIEEVDSEKVAKTGDTMTGQLFINTPPLTYVPISPDASGIISGTNNVQPRFIFDAYGTGTAGQGNFIFRKAPLTAGVRSATQAGDIIGQFSWFGHDGTNYSPTAVAQIRGVAEETFTPIAQGSWLGFVTVGIGALASIVRGGVSADGHLFIGPTPSTSNYVIDANRHHQLRPYTVAGLPSAATAGQMIYVSDESGGAVPAFSDGTNWRRVTDRAIVS